jgi:hypothetical protein
VKEDDGLDELDLNEVQKKTIRKINAIEDKIARDYAKKLGLKKGKMYSQDDIITVIQALEVDADDADVAGTISRLLNGHFLKTYYEVIEEP